MALLGLLATPNLSPWSREGQVLSPGPPGLGKCCLSQVVPFAVKAAESLLCRWRVGLQEFPFLTPAYRIEEELCLRERAVVFSSWPLS